MNAADMSTADITACLTDILGRNLTAYIAGTGRDADARRAAAYKVVQVLLPVADDGTIRAWMIGRNPVLNDRAPAEAIAGGGGDRALAAAWAYATGAAA